MPITYIITKDNDVNKIGEIDKTIFSPEFQSVTLKLLLDSHPNFIKWVDMVYNSGISKKPEYKFADGFGTWFIYKIGEKGVDRAISLADSFESNYNNESVDSVIGFNALIDFIQQDWDNEKKQFLETNNVRKIVEKSIKKVRRVIRDAADKKKADALGTGFTKQHANTITRGRITK